MLFISELHKFPEVYGSPCSTGFWFPKSLESWLRLFLVYCNTKDNPLQTSAILYFMYCKDWPRLVGSIKPKFRRLAVCEMAGEV